MNNFNDSNNKMSALEKARLLKQQKAEEKEQTKQEIQQNIQNLELQAQQLQEQIQEQQTIAQEALGSLRGAAKELNADADGKELWKDTEARGEILGDDKEIVKQARLQQQEFTNQLKQVQEIIKAEQEKLGITSPESTAEELPSPEQQITEIKQLQEEVLEVSQYQVDQITKLGGSIDELNELTKEIDREIEETAKEGVRSVEGESSQFKDIEKQEVILTAEEEKELSKINLEKKYKEERKDYLKKAIENTQYQKKQYEKGLDLPVSFVFEEYRNGIAKFMVPEAEEYTNLRSQFPEHPFVQSVDRDYFVERLKEKGYSQEKIESFKNKRTELDSLMTKIREKYGPLFGGTGSISFSYSNDINKRSVPYINVGHGAHTFDASLAGKTMRLGDLLDKEEFIKKAELKEVEVELAEMEERKNKILNKQ